MKSSPNFAFGSDSPAEMVEAARSVTSFLTRFVEFMDCCDDNRLNSAESDGLHRILIALDTTLKMASEKL
ncbi:hypothetical protein CSB45_00925 [candidate division KSB3 bacterium]|uniref:Uncharacterized protein n=1 Tax=candidate division KSB3 bacterium TaxID=2044937 RepID=A0A2G6EB64_9BACT|nr:MAG: hypothetical protein CSB45_00925 [candidate division KSB3 bacterium]